jgi:hypothetical protein
MSLDDVFAARSAITDGSAGHRATRDVTSTTRSRRAPPS